MTPVLKAGEPTRFRTFESFRLCQRDAMVIKHLTVSKQAGPPAPLRRLTYFERNT